MTDAEIREVVELAGLGASEEPGELRPGEAEHIPVWVLAVEPAQATE